MRKLAIGIIGCGYWGPNFVRNFNSLKGSYVKYVSDLSTERLSHIKKLYPDVLTTHDYRRILKNRDIDAVVISTPAHRHHSIARDALLNNKHVLVEKPITTKVAEAKDLINLAKDKKLTLMVGHTFKFNPGVNKLKSLIESKKLGKIYYIYSHRTNLGPLRKDVNAMWDLAPHDISIISYLLNSQPLDVSAKGNKFLEHDLEDVVFMNFNYPHNIFVHVHVSWLDPRKVREIVVVGSKKMAIFDDLDSKHPVKVYDKTVVKKHFKQSYDTFKEFQMIVKEGSTTAPAVVFKEPLRIECEHFLCCIKANKVPLTDGVDGLNVLKALIAVQRSLSSGGNSVSISRDPSPKHLHA